jgi:hypothetical protein
MPWSDFEKNVASALVGQTAGSVFDQLLAQAQGLLYEEGDAGYPDYGAWVTWENDGIQPKVVIHHSRGWKPKEARPDSP